MSFSKPRHYNYQQTLTNPNTITYWRRVTFVLEFRIIDFPVLYKILFCVVLTYIITSAFGSRVYNQYKTVAHVANIA